MYLNRRRLGICLVLLSSVMLALAVKDFANEESLFALTAYEEESAIHSLVADPMEKEPILVLGDQNISEAIGQYENLLIEFYSPRCGHCQHFAPEYEKLATLLENEGVPVRLAKVDDTIEKNTSKKFEIYAYPTLNLIQNGNISEYPGRTKSQDIITWLKFKTDPLLRGIVSLSDVYKALEQYKSVVVLLGTKSSEGLETFRILSKIYQDVAFLYTENKTLEKEFGVDSGTQLVMFTNSNPDKIKFSGVLNAMSLKTFIDQNNHPLVPLLSTEIMKAIFEGGSAGLILILHRDQEGEEALVSLETSVEDLPDNLTVCACFVEDDNENLCLELSKYLGLNEPKLPKVKLLNFEQR